MRLEYQITFEDYAEGANFLRKKQIWTRLFYILIGLLPLLCGSFLAVSSPLIAYLLILHGLTALWALGGFQYESQLRTLFVQESVSPLILEVGESGIQMEAEFWKIQGQWPALLKWEETSNLFLLYRSRDTPFMIPKRAFAAAQMEEFRAYLGAVTGAGL